MTTTLTTREWVHPRTGEVRRYISSKQVEALMPDADPRGNGYSKADYARVRTAKYWLDAAGALHINDLIERGRVHEADVRAVIMAALG